jgi:hypothetical protein
MDYIFGVLKWVSNLSTLVLIASIVYGIYLYARGILPVLYRLGRGLSSSKIVVFAKSNHWESLKGALIESGLFRDKNIGIITTENDFDKAQNYSVFLVYWYDWVNQFDEILKRTKDNVSLIVYVPPEIDPETKQPDKIPPEIMNQLSKKRNAIVVRFRGRLMNDILISMMTKSCEGR